MSEVTLRLGDCLELMKELPDASIDLTVTSPPYDDLRTYGNVARWNLDVFMPIAREFYRVTKQGGVVVWVVNDETTNGSESLTSAKQKIFFREECGFNIHDTMIYEKLNFSSPSQNRYHSVFEFMFVLSKDAPKTFNPIKDKRNATAGAVGNFGTNTYANPDGTRSVRGKKITKPFGMRGNVWRGKTCGQENVCKTMDHPAKMPSWVARDHILSWSNEGDTVLDPFLGSGTTGKMAVKLQRNFIGFEIHEPYFAIAQRRIAEAQLQMPLPLEIGR